MTTRKWLVAVALMCGLPRVSHSVSSYVFRDKECKTLGNSESQVNSDIGSLSIGFCKKGQKDLVCTYEPIENGDRIRGGESTTTYVTALDEDGTMFFKSPSGNIQIFADEKSGQYLYGMVIFLPEKGLMMNKLCTGSLKRSR